MGLFTKHITTEIHIAAPIERVWQAIVDLPQYGRWNEFIPWASGDLRLGGRINIEIQLHGERSRNYAIRITSFEANTSLGWLGHFYFPLICDGNHSFKLIRIDDVNTQLIHSEEFTGLIIPFIWKTFGPKFFYSFGQLNLGLKRYVESNPNLTTL